MDKINNFKNQLADRGELDKLYQEVKKSDTRIHRDTFIKMVDGFNLNEVRKKIGPENERNE